MLPWWVRNYAVSGQFVPTSSEVGASLVDGLNPSATGASDMTFKDNLLWATRFDPERLQQPTQFELAIDRTYRDYALTFARREPRRVLELGVIKFSRMWNIWPNENEFRSWPMRLVVAATYLPLLVLIFLGLRRWGRQWTCWLLFSPAIYFTLLHMIFVSSIRYRLPPLLPLMAIAAAVIAVWLGEKLASDDTTPKLAFATQKPKP